MKPRFDGPSFPHVETPRATIVIPVYGKWSLTLACLRSVAGSGDATPFDVVVVDDQSPDDTAGNLALIAGVTAVSTPQNLGFVGACNLGASRARGEVLVFLNNDTEVHPGWLDRLVEVLDDDPSVGLVGSMLLGTDGRVQESGGIIWSDGTGWNFGRGDAATDGAVRARRDVDYCSGAALAVRKVIFDELGGFDDRYAPAYYEDTDLSFGVRAAGYRVVVQPESVVTHLEGASNGADGMGGLKRFQEVNRLAFVRKWREVLATHSEHSSAADVWERSNRRPAGMALIVEPVVLTPDRDSGSRRMSAIVDELGALGLSIYYAVGEHFAIEPYRRALERRGVTVLESAAEQRKFLEEAGDRLRAVFLCRIDTAWRYLDLVYQHAPQATLIFDTVDLHGLRMGRQATVESDERLAHRARLVWIKERAAMRAADVTLVVSADEKDLIARADPDLDVRVLSNIHAPVVTDPRLDGRDGIVFVGGYLHPPNVDAAMWAVREIMPRVWDRLPGVTLHLLGSFMPAELSALDGPGVDARGWVADLAPCYRSSRVVIAPLRYGAGVKGKVAEAIEHGVPLVGTSIALEGMDLADGVDVLQADAAGGFADAVVRLLTDDQLWQEMAGHGQEALQRQFSSKLARDVLEGVLDEPGRRPRSSGFENHNSGR